MLNNHKKHGKHFFIVEKYYYLVFCIYLISMFSSSVRVGVIATGLMLLAFIECFVKDYKAQFKLYRATVSVFIYLIWCFISVIWFGYSGVGFNSYFEAVSNSLLPMLFAFFVFPDYDRFWKTVLNSYIIAGIIGAYCLFIQPSWYRIFCIARGFDFRRLSFSYGSIVMGTMGCVTVITSLRFIILSNGKRGKIQYLFSCLFAFLSMQRSAWVVVGFSLILAHYYIFLKYRIIKLRFMFLEIIGIAIIFLIFKDQIMTVFSLWKSVRKLQYGGTITAGNAINERSNQWIRGIEHSNVFFGSGFGSRGHKAASNGFSNYVADGNWVLILCESGIIGLSLFIYFCLKAMLKGILNFNKLFLPTGVILAFMLQSIGSNVLEQQLNGPLFWLAIGQILHYKTSTNNKMLRYLCKVNL